MLCLFCIHTPIIFFILNSIIKNQLRKNLGCPIGITQNPEDVLSTDDEE